MDTRRLRYFVEIVEAGSITRAAVKAGVAQPALSQQMAVLETEMRAKLLSRSSSGVEPTAAGRALYAHAKALLRQIEELQTTVREQSSGLGGTVLICIPPTLADVFTLPLIEAAQEGAPTLNVHVVERGSIDVVQLLRDGEVDLAVASRTPDPEMDIASELLFVEPFLLAVPGNMPIEAPLSLERMAAMPWLSSRQPYSARTLLDSEFEQAGLKRRIVAEFDTFGTILMGVQRGLGVAVVPASLTHFAESMSGVRMVDLGEAAVTRPVFLWTRRAPAPAPSVIYIADLIRRLSAEHLRAKAAPE